MELAPAAPLLLGRVRERKILQESLAAARGRSELRFVQLKGPPGAGRSALLDDLERHARAEGVAIMRSSPPGPASESYEPGRMIARLLGLGVLRGGSLDAAFVRAVQDWGWSDPLILDGLRRLIQPRVRFPDPRDGALRAGMVVAFLERLCTQRPGGVLLVMPDLHEQPDCLRFAQHLAQEELSLPLLVVLSHREGVLAWRSRQALALEMLGEDERCTKLSLGPIPGPQALSLARRMGLSSADSARVAQLSAGRLEALVELARDRRERDSLLAVSEPQAIQAARLALSVEPSGVGNRCLAMAAVLGRSVDKREWERACEFAGMAPPPGLLSSLYRRRLLVRTSQGFAFRRRSLYSVLLQGVRATGQEVRLNQIAAGALVGTKEAGVCARRAQHLILAERPVDGASSMLRAAKLCLEAGDHDSATQLLEDREALLARLSSSDEVARAEGLILLATSLRLVGRLEEAGRVSKFAERRGRWSGDPEVRTRSLICKAQTLLVLGQAGGALSCLRDARAALGEVPVPARLLLLKAQACVALGDPERALVLLESYLAEADDLGAAQALCTQAEALMVLGRDQEAEAALDEADTRAWSAQSATEAVRTRLLRAKLHERTGGLERASQISSAAAALVRRSGLPNAVEPDVLIASWEFSQGEHKRSLERLRVAARWLRGRNRGPEGDLVYLMVAGTQICTGEFEQGLRLLDALHEPLQGSTQSSERLLPILREARRKARAAQHSDIEERLAVLLSKQERLTGRAG